MRHAVIMAGGAGTRLWPLSRSGRPKQLMRLFEGASLLELARRRVAPLFEAEQTWVITSARYLDQIAKALPDVPRENLIGEPVGRDTANAVGLAAALIERRDPDATMAVFTADHVITPQDRFERAIRTGLDAAELHTSALITFAIAPTGPKTSYGYLQRGAERSAGVYAVERFKEKPDLPTAQKYLAGGDHYWNSGMFVWRVSAIQTQFEALMPESAAQLSRLAERWSASSADAVRADFEALEKISIDFAIMEKAPEVLLVPMDCNWLDLGSWTSIGQTATPDESGNAALAQRSISQASKNTLLVSEDPEHLLVALGVEDVVVVHSADATLVCHRDHEQAIKELVALRQAEFGTRYE